MIVPPHVCRATSPFLIAAGLALGSLTACESDPAARSMRNRVPDLVDVLHTDSTNEQAVNPGMLLAFDLPAHAGTGYSWELLGSSPEFLAFVGDPVFTPADPGRMGSSGTSRFLVEVTGIGKATIVFQYLRSWETDTAPVRTARVEIDSTKKGD